MIYINFVRFPILNLEFNIPEVAFKLFGIEIYYYAIIIVFAIIIAFHRYRKKSGKFEIKFENIIDLSIFLIPIAFIGARIYYVIFNLDFYLLNPMQILNIRSGGIAIYGGIIAGVIVIYFYCKKNKLQLLDLTDFIVPELALAQSIGRWGNFINIEAYGKETNLPWRMEIIENGVLKAVHPTFLYESIVTFIIFIILTKLTEKRKFKGEITYIYIICYSIARFFIEGLRTDSLMLKSIKISGFFSVVLFVVFCSILFFNINKFRKHGEKIEIRHTKVAKNE